MTGGRTSTLLALGHADGRATVLRVIDREPWATHRADLATRERATQLVLAPTGVPAPLSLALDAEAGAHLMTLLPGRHDERRADDDTLHELARTLATVHDVRPATPPRRYQSWAWEAKYVVPAWARRPDAWEAAFALLRGEAPAYDDTFLHRDFHAANVLWVGSWVSGVVDWVETSTGPAWLDVAHAGTNLAVQHGVERADAFAAAYTALTGRARDAWWEVMDTVGFLPPPGRRPFLTDPLRRQRLEERLVASLRRT